MSQCSTISPACETDVELAAKRWTSHMLRGDFASAWRESDLIRASGRPDPHRFWDGEPIDGRRVILRCLHGLGDAVQFLRYVPKLADRAGSLVIEVPPRMSDLASLIDGVSKITTWNDPPNRDEWDSQVEVMELPYLFRTKLCELPIAQNYLTVPHPIQSRVASRTGKTQRPRIGIVWAAGEWNPTRSIPFSMLHSLLFNTDCEFWNLQGGSAAAEWELLPRLNKLRDARELGNGLTTLAACIQQMDLIITVDTLAAHLAGAMGKPAWLMLTTPCDWRWMSSRSDSPWYPSLRLYRQEKPGDWQSAIKPLMRDLGAE